MFIVYFAPGRLSSADAAAAADAAAEKYLATRGAAEPRKFARSHSTAQQRTPILPINIVPINIA